jgi:hypothetical protein
MQSQPRGYFRHRALFHRGLLRHAAPPRVRYYMLFPEIRSATESRTAAWKRIVTSSRPEG